jgi:hypothetical protein
MTAITTTWAREEKIPKNPLYISAVTIDTPDPNPSACDIAPHSLWSSSRSDPRLITDVNVFDISPCETL